MTRASFDPDEIELIAERSIRAAIDLLTYAYVMRSNGIEKAEALNGSSFGKAADYLEDGADYLSRHVKKQKPGINVRPDMRATNNRKVLTLTEAVSEAFAVSPKGETVSDTKRLKKR